ncbi:iron ABC transporter permease [Thermococcus sp. GR7]|uniref:FecCD family ABC transporter permease n=1 Tax=unclassified Thermococcus TaxID=2627626 RepID=UPI0014314FA9|nr:MULTISPECIES: iron ABC transporter permease [unclassified Thermococcus]NJE46275.1 iron ABC transporter permease [Thermococcus sp. GR7]NJE79225.1 iron ABC transporter permease [Thermococcus sp. GR4]NJF23846.1 iron ABC transporter permease [Thermococcus sp. GR5]
MKRFVFLYFIVFISSLFVGRFAFSPFNMDELAKTILVDVRLPRIVAASLVGASLSLAGLAFQNVFRNYLAGPNILGVTSGAAFGAVVAIMLFSFNPYFVQMFAFVFGITAVFIAYKMSRLVGNGIVGLLLAGIAVSAFFSALVGMAKYLADPYDQLPTIVFWLLGSFAGIRWVDLKFFSIPMIIGIAGLILLRWAFNVLSLGEEEAKALGMNVSLYKKLVIGLAALAVSAATAVSGIISWVGLVSPHIARLLVGYDNRKLVPASAFTGAILLVICDDIARTLTPAELPLGVVTSLIGAPILVAILARRREHAKG